MSRNEPRLETPRTHLGRRGRHCSSREELARHLGITTVRCEELFQKWCGLSAEDWIELAMRAHARNAFRRASCSSGVALDASRAGAVPRVSFETAELHASPAWGADVRLRWGVHETPMGWAVLATVERGLCGLEFLDVADAVQADRDAAILLRELWPQAAVERHPATTLPFARALDDCLRGRPSTPVPVVLVGTSFQREVWLALTRIPPGRTVTYGEIARAVGRPTSARAVGRAVGSNPIGVFIPCHRVVHADGALGGYRWGELRKRLLLAVEERFAG